jgi:hypothetical protein
MNTLIHCGDGHTAPTVLICRHVAEETAHTWVRFPLLMGEETSDCLCQKCFRKGPSRLRPGRDLRSCCMHCFNCIATSTKAAVVTATPEDCVRYGFWEKS